MVWPLVEQLLLHQLTNEGMTCSPKKWRALRLTPISGSADFPYPMVKNLQINFVTEESPGMWGCISERREWMLSMTVFLWVFFLAGDFQSRLFKTTLPPQYTVRVPPDGPFRESHSEGTFRSGQLSIVVIFTSGEGSVYGTPWNFQTCKMKCYQSIKCIRWCTNLGCVLVASSENSRKNIDSWSWPQCVWSLSSPVLVLQQQLVQLLRLCTAVQVVSLLQNLLCTHTHTQTHTPDSLRSRLRPWHIVLLFLSGAKNLLFEQCLTSSTDVIYLFPKPGPQLNSALCDKPHKPDRKVQGAPGGMQLLQPVHNTGSEWRKKGVTQVHS